MVYNESQKKADFEAFLSTALKQAHELGYVSGFEKGTAFGYALAMEHTKAAVSDGMKKGSSECGKNMRSRRRQKNTSPS
ncbi:hypothetical protein [Thalassospira profundimaris]|uniref:hypothetical protein n=1 Tax=Thalassospira profundimaris TaxID=502049 RepID=UPI0011BED305|nr:hypothetical protein [Thalassospira profundimaris]